MSGRACCAIYFDWPNGSLISFYLKHDVNTFCNKFWFNSKFFFSKEGNITQYYLILDLNINVKILCFLFKNMHYRVMKSPKVIPLLLKINIPKAVHNISKQRACFFLTKMVVIYL